METSKPSKSLEPRKKCNEVDNRKISREIQHLTTESKLESKEPWLKCRYVAATIGFFVFFFLNFYRMNMSVGIVDMVNNSALFERTKGKSESCHMFLVNRSIESADSEDGSISNSGEFNWTPTMQGHILGSYFFTYVVMQMPSGKLVERYGCKWVFFGGTTIAAVATLAIPVASRFHAYALIAVQILRGIGQGVYQPAASILQANWFPTRERSVLCAFVQSGVALGSFLGSIIAGLLCKSAALGGWPSSFYASGIAGLLLSAAIAQFFHESPRSHPRISKAELEYILRNQENALSRRRPNPPWGKMLRSVPVYALAIGCFGQMWAISQFLVVHSIFLGTILHYPIEQNGFFSAVPFLLMFLFSQMASFLSDFMMKRKIAGVDKVRKFWNSMACVGNTACLLGLYFAGCNRCLSAVFSALSVGFAGFGISSIWITSTDMSPNFAASVHAACCTFGFFPSFILPLVVGYLTNEMQTIEQWNKVFFITIGIVMSSGIIFSIFGRQTYSLGIMSTMFQRRKKI